MNQDEFYKTLTSLSEKDQLDVINAMSTEDAKLLSDYHDSQQSPEVAQLPEVVDNSNQSDLLDQVSSVLSQTSPNGISLEGLTPEQQMKVVERDSPLIKPIQDGTIRNALGGGSAANLAENVAQGAVNVARGVTGTLKAAGNFISGNPAEQMADTLRFENQLDQEGSTGVGRMGRMVSHHLGQSASMVARSPVTPFPVIKGFTAAKGALGVAKAIAGNFAVDFGMIAMIEGAAQTLEALGDQTTEGVKQRVTDTVGTAVMGAAFGATARTVGAGIKGGLSKLAVSYDKSQNAQKIVAGLADKVNEAKDTLGSFVTQFDRLKRNLVEKKVKIDNKTAVTVAKIESKAQSKARNELSELYKSKDGLVIEFNNAKSDLAGLSNDAVNLMSSGESLVRGTINKSYDTILDGEAGQKALDISGYIDDMANQLGVAGSQDIEISTAFIGSMRKILPGISFNKIDDAAKTLMDTGGSLTVKQAHTLRVDMNDMIRKKINDPKLIDQMVALRDISNKIGEDIGAVAGKEYKATNAMYSQYIDNSAFIDQYVGPLKTSLKQMPGQDAAKRSVVRLGTDDKLNKFAEVAPPDVEGFFKGGGTDTSSLTKQLELQNTEAQSFYKQIELFNTVGKKTEADSLASTISLYAKQMVNVKGLEMMIKNTTKMIDEISDNNLKVLIKNSPEMQQINKVTGVRLKSISDQIFKLENTTGRLKEGVTAAQNAAKAEVSRIKTTGDLTDSDMVALNSTLNQIGWSSGSQPLKMAMLNIAAWNSLLHYGPRIASKAMKGIGKIEDALLAKQNADDITRVARKGLEVTDKFIKSKKLTIAQKSAWTWTLETIGYDSNESWEEDRKQKKALQEFNL